VSVSLGELAHSSSLSQEVEQFRARSIVLAMRDQLSAALALIELDGIAARLILCPPDQSDETLAAVAADSAADVLIVDQDRTPPAPSWSHEVAGCGPRLRVARAGGGADRLTEWVLLTSGTSGKPKLVVHTLVSLAGEMQSPHALGRGCCWSTCYDVRRYGGLQILLRALLGGGSMLFSDAHEPVRDFMGRAAAAGVSHISGTPSHWRRILMSGAAQLISPQYLRLSGEISDQALLDELRACYPKARIAHAFASTEAGLAFDVEDGRAGFPADLLSSKARGIELKIENGSLLIRSPRTANRYLNQDTPPLRRLDGFVDTHDLLELRDGRYHFIGRNSGIINVGGLKCHPEEIEAVINAHPRVLMSLVKARKSPLLGNIVVADVVLKDAANQPLSDSNRDLLLGEIMAICRKALSPFKVPASIRLVNSLEVSASGKIQRSSA